MREVDDSQHLREFSNKKFILTNYIISSCWLHLLYGLGNYVILPGEIEQVLVMTNNIMTLGYTYAKLRLNNTPDIIYKLTHIGHLITWTPSRLSWDP